MSRLKTISILDRLYTITPYEGSRLIIRVEDDYYVSGRDCEVVGAIMRDERLPENYENYSQPESDEAEK
ncbi:MAG: hypothetical protein P9L94_03070 [Candidatus Hinthialibacter antarcticus]|nr:hypothetical protein [Candidatus Hinthialibacter antarcticus]